MPSKKRGKQKPHNNAKTRGGPLFKFSVFPLGNYYRCHVIWFLTIFWYVWQNYEFTHFWPIGRFLFEVADNYTRFPPLSH